ncbi:hypothetical protein JT358_08810 [Micrococcales bacterium 31B]|nr:hypothetical protein [Micrococcales bacterium 31B]
MYVQSSGGWDLASASRLLGVGTVVALLVPALISRLSLRLAPRTFVLTAQLTLAASSALFLLTGSTVAFVAGAVLWSCGMQAFYASVFALIADYPVGEGGDVSFARASMARDGAFAVATALAAFILERLGSEVLMAFLVANLVSCLLAAVIIALGVPGGRATLASETGAQPATVSVLRTPGFLALILVAVALNLPVDLHLMATPVFVTGHSAAPTWVAGVSIAVLSVTTSVGATIAVRVTARLSRRANLLLATGLFLLWASLMALAGCWARWPARSRFSLRCSPWAREPWSACRDCFRRPRRSRPRGGPDASWPRCNIRLRWRRWRRRWWRARWWRARWWRARWCGERGGPGPWSPWGSRRLSLPEAQLRTRLHALAPRCEWVMPVRGLWVS